MPGEIVTSWGRVMRAEHSCAPMYDRHAPFPSVPGTASVLPFGNGRSYGDVCLNPGGTLIQTRALDRFIQFDAATGRLTCEAGVLLSELLDVVVPRGWFLPVTPGTQYVTVGGAIANDVHGKNHHATGTFGCHVLQLELLRSDNSRQLCSRDSHESLFAATVGGLGLTGVITWAELQLRPVESPMLDVETIRFRGLDEFFALCAESDQQFEYTVAWVDCSQTGRGLGRGLFMRANHARAEANGTSSAPGRPHRVPFSFPAINRLSVRAFNQLYYRRQFSRVQRGLQHYRKFFYPLDGVLQWNRLYGARGFYQYQCVVPMADAQRVTRALLLEIARSGMGSFLNVLKVFGNATSPGMLSFPQPGVTLALDFANRGPALETMFGRLDALVAEAGGRLYPAKDGRMPGSLFRSGYPRWREFAEHIDARFSSGFWRRVMEGG
jgi:FAD/FMN-containing dehydrogenase